MRTLEIACRVFLLGPLFLAHTAYAQACFGGMQDPVAIIGIDGFDDDTLVWRTKVSDDYKDKPLVGKFWEEASIEWNPPSRWTATCVELTGKILLQREGQQERPVDWLQGLEVLVAEEEAVANAWSGDQIDAATWTGRGYTRPDGSFALAVHAPDLARRFTESLSLFVALRLAETEPGKIRWKSAMPLLESSRARIRNAVEEPFGLDEFRRTWNAVSWGGELYRGPLDEPHGLVDVPEIRALPPDGAASVVPAQVEAWVDELAAVCEPGPGYSGTLAGSQFLPVPSIRRADALIFVTDHGLAVPPALERLEAAGPAALSALARHLDDARPTALTIRQEPGFGAMWQECRIEGNPLNARERDALGRRTLAAYGRMHAWSLDEEHLESYTPTVGDLCFVALGQITNRVSYRAVQYQPSGCTVLTGMQTHPDLVAALREIWAVEDPRQALLDWLLVDFSSRGTQNTDLQIGAATRLAYYFPREAGQLLARRIDSLPVEEDLGVQRDATGVYACDLLEAVAFSTDVEIQSALLRVLWRTRDRRTIDACFVTRGKDPVMDKLLEVERLLPLDGAGPTGAPYEFLWTVRKHQPEGLRRVVEAFLEQESIERAHAVCLFFARTPDPEPWIEDVLRPLLQDRRQSTWYAVESAARIHPTRPVLVCDLALAALERMHGDRQSESGFSELRLEGTREELDQRIATMERGR